MRPFILLIPVILCSACGCGGAAKDIASAAENAADTLSKGVVEAADKIDPVALKKILNENDELQAKIDALKDAIKNAEASPGVVNLRDGHLEIVARVHDVNNPFRYVVQLDKKKKMIDGAVPGHSGQTSHNSTAVLDPSIVHPGTHTIHVSIKAGGGYMIELDLVHVHTGGQRDVVQTAYIQSSQNYEMEDGDEGLRRFVEPHFSFNALWKQ
ncbi:MAG: hypothetical protein ABJZ55_16350 [Fuerstiella sp.]